MIDTQNYFWKWFKSQEKEYFEFEKKQDVLFDELQNRLKKIDKNITFEFGPKINGKREFIITAGGIRSSFPSVKELVDKVPHLDKFEVIAFRPRLKGYNSVRYGDIELSIRDVFFDFQKIDKVIDINLYVRNYENNAQHKMAIYLLLDMLLGEYDVETKIGTINRYKLFNKDKKVLLPIKELPQIVDKYFR